MDFNFDRYCLKKLLVSVPELKTHPFTKQLVDHFFLKSLPDYRSVTDEEMGVKTNEMEFWGSYIFYEDIFCPFILSLINKKNPTSQEKDMIIRCFNLIE